MKKVKGRYSLVKLAEASLYTGALGSSSVKPVAVGGLWYPAPLGKYNGSSWCRL